MGPNQMYIFMFCCFYVREVLLTQRGMVGSRMAAVSMDDSGTGWTNDNGVHGDSLSPCEFDHQVATETFVGD